MAGHGVASRVRTLMTRMLRRPGRASRSEEGFTLIELLIVIVILPLVIGAVAIVMITSLKATDTHDLEGTNQRLAESHDTQLTSAYFVRDVQGASLLQTQVSGAQPLCKNTFDTLQTSPADTVTQLLGLEWGSGPTMVSYVLVSKSGTPLEVARNFCTNGVSPTTSPPTIVSHNVSAANPATLVCNTAIPGNCQTDASSAPPTSPISTLRVNTVEIDITEKSGFVYRLIASPRQVRGASPGIAGSAPTLLLADGGSCGTGNIAVNGVAAVDYGTLSFQNQNGSFTAQQVYEGVTTITDGSLVSGSSTLTSASGPFNSSMVGEPISDSAGAIPGGTTIKSFTSATQIKMTANASSSQTNDSVTIGPNSAISPSGAYGGGTASGAPITDPYASLPAPSPTASDTYVESTLFQPSGALTPGVYIIEAGLKLGGNGSVTVGSALGDGTDGVFFYVEGGSVTLGGSSTVNVSAISNGPYSSVYGGLLLYQIASDTNGMTLDGSSSATTLNGVIAAPSASVTLNGGGNGSGLTAFGLEAATINCNGNNTTTVLGPPLATSWSTYTSSINPSNNGSTVTFTAKLVASGGIVPTGSITFSEKPNGGVAATIPGCGSVALDSTGTATCSTSTLTSVGSPYTISALYNPSAGFLAPTTNPDTLTQTVNSKIATTTTLTASPNPANFGQLVTYTATVNAVAATGTVNFTDGGTSISGCSAKTLSGGVATCTFTYTTGSGGIHSIVATYSGDSTYGGSTSNTVKEYVNPLHIKVLTGVDSGKSGGNWTATVTITVVDSSGNGVAGVTISGSWGVSSGGSISSCTTDSTGGCKTSGSGKGPINSGNISTSNASDTYTVTSISLANYAWYQPGDVADSVAVPQ